MDDIMVVSDVPQDTIDGFKCVFKLKGDKAAIPDMYIGASLSYAETINRNKCWSMSSAKYVQTAIDNIGKTLRKKGRKSPAKCVTPITYKYRSEEDETSELLGKKMTYFQELIGILRWAIEIGRADILLEVTQLSSHLATPRNGHMEQVYHIFGYLKENLERKIYLDPDHPDVKESRFQKFIWNTFTREQKN